MILTLGNYIFEFKDGGIFVKKDGELLYFIFLLYARPPLCGF